MFVSLAFLVAAQGIVVPLGKPPRIIEQPRAPIATAGPAFAAACKDAKPTDFDMPAPPVRIHANTYLVGTCGVSAILIAGTGGAILIDGGTEKGADLIARNIEDLGFRLRDVKILLNSHEHFDHSGGLARLQQLTGAALYTSPAAARVLETGTASADDPQAGMHAPFPAAHVDRILHDGEMVRLGNLALFAVTTPGHAPGSLSWHWGACDGGVCRQIVYSDSLNPLSRDDYRFSDHPAYLAAYRASIAKIAALNCDILLTPHPITSQMAERLVGAAPLEDPNACRAYAERSAKQLDERLAKEAAGK